MKKLTTAPTLVTIHHYKNLLAAEGIATVIRNEYLGAILGEMPFADTWPQLWVVNDLHFDRAGQLISGAAGDESPADDWRCAACGETNEGQFAACWNCSHSAS